jgi:hypothetical protein
LSAKYEFTDIAFHEWQYNNTLGTNIEWLNSDVDDNVATLKPENMMRNGPSGLMLQVIVNLINLSDNLLL